MDNSKLFEFIARLNSANSYEEIRLISMDFCHAFGFDNFIYGARIPTSMVSPQYISISGYPPEWRDYYVENDYIGIDPTVSHCFTKTTPVYWETILKTTCKQDQQVNKLFYEADDFGLCNGISFPIHCIHGETAMFSLATGIEAGKSRSHIQQTLAFGHLFACYVHEAVTRVPDNGILSMINANLTDREKECLLWTTEGKTSWEVSQIINISERTVVFHLNNAMKKLNVVNKQHAVARAISLGQITPQL
ncbi:MAG: LuxR family transcriptional regulator [Gammaproteobacteria bacterium]|nr:LuxR family transcriptional regulator [Gammaproteobacteria bacterium]MDH5778320.1 LuxR family transcriptional regulator [Gammaproteobacteria bacterium]